MNDLAKILGIYDAKVKHLPSSLKTFQTMQEPPKSLLCILTWN